MLRQDQNQLQLLHDNHLSFLSKHRGTLTDRSEFFTLQSEKPEFTFAIVREGKLPVAVKEQYRIIQVLPGAAEYGNELLAQGLVKVGGLSYMVLKSSLNDWEMQERLQIKQAAEEQDIVEFSRVQASAFTSNLAEFDSWYPFLHAANLKNYKNKDQDFYIALLDNEPVGVCLVVRTAEVAGLYAVATLEKHRKKGISTTLMKHAISEAKKLGCQTITLQVSSGSYAEQFYKKLGFQTEFQVDILKS